METTDTQVSILENKLKNMQTQLEKSEKLASLGTLSAGIAHEIQNPLNFVINFSQMANDMVDDLTDILDEMNINIEDAGNTELKETINTLRSYLAKIAEHGHRATDIIQGILLYSRGKADQIIPTDLSELLKKYVWLSFHAMRANLTDFNVTIHEDYDPSIGMVNIVPQDLSRAIINLMNNACYAVWKKQKSEGDTYQPTITVRTRRSDHHYSIEIEDNGIGMSEETQKQIFTAFFTTKPAGEGTGLGLSITRNIIENQHHGKISFESKEGEYTKFTLELPL